MKNKAFKKLSTDKKPDAYSKGAGDQMLIYIPETRRCKRQCGHEKCICDHLVESFGHNSIYCGLQLVQV